MFIPTIYRTSVWCLAFLILILSGVHLRAATFNVSTPAQLIAAINSANGNSEDDIIEMTTGTYTLTAVNNTDAGANGLPTVNTVITINGNGSTIQRNSGAPDFRLLFVDPFGVLTLNDLTLSGGRLNTPAVSASGGAISSSGDLSMFGCTVRNNSVLGSDLCGGGGVLAKNMILEDCIFENNTATASNGFGMGGGVSIFSGSITRCIARGNTVNGTKHPSFPFGQATGGGFYLGGADVFGAGGVVVMTDSAVYSNSAIGSGAAYGAGGGIATDSPGKSITNVTISGNSAIGGTRVGHGGALLLNTGCTVSHCTIVNNTVSASVAGSTSGGIASARLTAPATLDHVLLGGNTPSNYGLYFHDFTTALHLTSLGYNLSSDNSAAVIFVASGDVNNTNPMISPTLANNGGTTPNHLLLPGSPCIDTGDEFSVLVTDQRGVARPFDGDGDLTAIVDIGAIEYVPPPNAILRWNIFE